MLEIIIGIVLAIGVCVIAHVAKMDRERVFYPFLLMVIASYYLLFAAIGNSIHAALAEMVPMALFSLLAIWGFKRNLWIVVGALIAHGVFDFSHALFINNDGVPIWWPGFCAAFDIVCAAYLARQIKAKIISP